ncbi:MAG: phosphate transport system permease protein [Solirubrobacteraceae bacterium]|jgi:phosphate transport system permease protein|nr:phosphate transport system permease protein [Solirubrobacteraceae bacterium]
MSSLRLALGATRPGRRRAGTPSSWSRSDRIGVAACWAAGILLCLICAAILIYMMFRGLQYLTPSLLFSHPQASLNQSQSGGFLDPLIGTFVLTTMGILIALPIGIGVAVWLVEYGRPPWLARMVESGVEVVAGTPSIVLAIFGLLLFTQNIFGFLSFTAEGNAVFGRSFFTAGAMMSLIALPLVVGGTREALLAIPHHVREASYAMGKTKAATIRRVLLPGARSGIATGATLGMGRIAGDTAIVTILLGASLQLSPQGGVPILRTLRGTGGTLTSYVYNNSPAGEGQAPQKAYAAAFVLLLIVIVLNFAVDMIGGRRRNAGWTK